MKNVLWNAFGNVVYLFAQWLVTVAVTRLYGLADAGILSLAMSISATFQTIALFGIRNFQVSDIEGKYSDSAYVRFRAVSCLTAFVLCLCFSLINGYGADTVAAILWFMLFRIAEDFSDVLHGILQKNDMLYKAGQALLFRGILVIISFLSGFLILKTVNGSLMFMAVAAVLLTFFYDYICAKKVSGFKLTFKFFDCFNLAKETVPLCVYLFLNSIILTAPKYILDKMSDKETLGAYSSIFAPPLILQAAAQYIYVPFITRFAEMYKVKDKDGFNRLLLKIVLNITVMGAAVFVVFLLFGKWALTLVFGEEILPYSDLMYLIILCVYFTALNAFFQTIAVIIRSFASLIASCIVGSIVCCCVSVPAIKLMGANGASVGLAAAMSAGTILLVINVLKQSNKWRVDREN